MEAFVAAVEEGAVGGGRGTAEANTGKKLSRVRCFPTPQNSAIKLCTGRYGASDIRGLFSNKEEVLYPNIAFFSQRYIEGKKKRKKKIGNKMLRRRHKEALSFQTRQGSSQKEVG